MAGDAAPTVTFNDFSTPAGPDLPSAIEIHAQHGVQIVGYQPFLTLNDSHAGYAKACIQTYNGDMVLYSKGGLDRSVPQMVIESAGSVKVTEKVTAAAGRFEGNVEITGDLLLENMDCAEDFDIAGATLVDPGTVMILKDDATLEPSTTAYDRRVAGVISGAGDCKAGIVLGRLQSTRLRQPVALLGKTFCKVDAQAGAIEVGDLLTTSSTPGHAMKADDPLRAFGAVIGKALRRHDAGQGMIPILIALR
jgi:hypothetical protein